MGKSSEKELAARLGELISKLKIDEARARRFLSICLPHGAGNPAIFHNAACVLAELGDVEGVMVQLNAARKHRYAKLDLMKRECAATLPTLAKDKRFRALV